MNNRDGFTRLRSLESPDATFWAADPPIVLQRARGSELYDVEGNRYIDLCAGFGALPLGHHHPSLAEVLRDTLEAPLPRIMHGLGDVCPSEDKIELLSLLTTLLPPHLTVTSLALGGAQGVETALKTAMLATQKSGFIAFHKAYHGVDFGVLPLTARAEFKAGLGGWSKASNVRHLPYSCSPAEVQAAILELAATAGFAGIMVEPIQGRGGMIPAELDWLKSLKDLCVKHRGLLIFDEVFTGLGRIGTWSTAFQVAADLIVIGKALGGGLPLSACVGTREVMASWPVNSGEAMHTGTFFGHPLSCRISRATLQVIQAEGLVERSAHLGSKTLQYLRTALAEVPGVKAVRGQGLFIGIEFHKPGFGAELMNQLARHGIIAIPCGDYGEGLSLTPALNIDEALWQQALATMVSLLRQSPSLNACD